MKNKFKAYQVKLEFLAPVDYVIEVLAENRKQAIKLGIERAPSEVGRFLQPDLCEARPNWDEDEQEGIYIKEIK